MTTTQTLAAPFSLLFADREEAEWAFNFLERSMSILGIKGPDDKRCALTLPRNEKGNLLRFNFVKDVTVDFRSAALNGTPAIYLAFQPIDFLEQYPHGGNFAAFKEPVKVYGLPYDIVRNMTPQMEQHYEKSFRYIGEVKAKSTGSPFRHAHQKQVMEAVFDYKKREELLDHGLSIEDSKVNDGDNPASPFSQSTFELLEELHHKPTAAYYLKNKLDFVAEVEAPFQRIMQRVAAQLPVSITNVMETEKRLFGRFLKNDFGQGGAWEFYWGAFYPKGSKRSKDAQLSVWMNYEYMEFGFYIGDYGSQQRRRFIDNCRLHKVQLGIVLEMLAADHFFYGKPAELPIKPDGSVGRPNAILQDWQNFLEDPDQLNCDVSVALPHDMLLQLSEDELVERIAAVHKQLFPLVLLCISDDPMTAIADYLDVDKENESEVPLPPPYTLAECAAETGIDETTLTEWLEAIERKGQAILYGPPGTGKTYVGERLARLLVADGGGITELVQFHPAYAYEDFIQGIRPQTSAEGHLIYPTVPGRFLEFCREAEKHSGICVLILDEINRANLSRVFGELMYLLEYRDRDIPLAGGGRLRIPKNVRILGTMNTADRSIALVDHALRRRFLFIALSPDMEVLRRFHQDEVEAFPVDKLIQVLERLNQRIQDRNYAVGTSYFLRKKLRGSISTIWRMEIEPYLEEYFFAQPDRIEEFRWQKVHEDLGL